MTFWQCITKQNNKALVRLSHQTYLRDSHIHPKRARSRLGFAFRHCEGFGPFVLCRGTCPLCQVCTLLLKICGKITWWHTCEIHRRTTHDAPQRRSFQWHAMAIKTTFTRYGHGLSGIIGITLKPETLKTWAFSLHTRHGIMDDLNAMRDRRWSMSTWLNCWGNNRWCLLSIVGLVDVMVQCQNVWPPLHFPRNILKLDMLKCLTRKQFMREVRVQLWMFLDMTKFLSTYYWGTQTDHHFRKWSALLVCYGPAQMSFDDGSMATNVVFKSK